MLIDILPINCYDIRAKSKSQRVKAKECKESKLKKSQRGGALLDRLFYFKNENKNIKKEIYKKRK